MRLGQSEAKRARLQTPLSGFENTTSRVVEGLASGTFPITPPARVDNETRDVSFTVFGA